MIGAVSKLSKLGLQGFEKELEAVKTFFEQSAVSAAAADEAAAEAAAVAVATAAAASGTVGSPEAEEWRPPFNPMTLNEIEALRSQVDAFDDRTDLEKILTVR